MGERVAVLGTGIMGAPMARNLLKAGFQVRVWLTDTAAVLAVMGQAAESIPHGAVWLQTSMDTDLDSVTALARTTGSRS